MYMKSEIWYGAGVHSKLGGWRPRWMTDDGDKNVYPEKFYEMQALYNAMGHHLQAATKPGMSRNRYFQG